MGEVIWGLCGCWVGWGLAGFVLGCGYLLGVMRAGVAIRGFCFVGFCVYFVPEYVCCLGGFGLGVCVVCLWGYFGFYVL